MPYESDVDLRQYLQFHFGEPDQTCPLNPQIAAYSGYPQAVIQASLAQLKITKGKRALDLGCSVGGSSFELARCFAQVIGMDFSRRFIDAARVMQQEGTILFPVQREGDIVDCVKFHRPQSGPVEKVIFEVGDACQLRPNLGQFDFVILSNLIDRIPDPAGCLAQMGGLVIPGGWLVIASPYDWNEAFTPKDRWLCSQAGTVPVLAEHLKQFTLRHTKDLPFLMRRDQRTFMIGISELSFWQRLDLETPSQTIHG